jgi:hypothetical protein
MLAFRDVVVTPFAGRPPFRRGGPRWPQWSTQTTARFCVRGIPQDMEPPAAEPASVVPGPIAWAGAITWHFGHQIAYFSTRLLPTLAEMPAARFAFGMHANHQVGAIAETPEYFRGILDWYGIGHERVDLIGQPTLAEQLVVAPQAEQTPRPGPEPWYLDMLDANAATRLGRIERSGSLYVSRAARVGRFAGEEYLEGALHRAGFQILRPETVPLAEQLRAYAGAETLVFAEGSAIHGTQLLGRALGDVTVLTRRPGHKLARAALAPRARSVRYVDAVRALVHGLDMSGGPALHRGLSVLDSERLQAVLPISPVWNREEFEAAVDADVRAWLAVEQASPRWAVAGAPEHVAGSVRQAGIELQP